MKRRGWRGHQNWPQPPPLQVTAVAAWVGGSGDGMLWGGEAIGTGLGLPLLASIIAACRADLAAVGGGVHPTLGVGEGVGAPRWQQGKVRSGPRPDVGGERARHGGVGEQRARPAFSPQLRPGPAPPPSTLPLRLATTVLFPCHQVFRLMGWMTWFCG